MFVLGLDFDLCVSVRECTRTSVLLCIPLRCVKPRSATIGHSSQRNTVSVCISACVGETMGTYREFIQSLRRVSFLNEVRKGGEGRT